jgi:hypothetical protein
MVQLSHLNVDIGTVQLVGNMLIFKSSIQAATLKAYRQLTSNTSLDGRQELTGIYLCQPLNLERLLVFTLLSLSIYTPWVSLSYLVSYSFASQASISLIPSSAIVLMVRDMDIRRHGHTFLICQFRLLLPPPRLDLVRVWLEPNLTSSRNGPCLFLRFLAQETTSLALEPPGLVDSQTI